MTSYSPISSSSATGTTSASPTPFSTNLDYISSAKRRIYSGLGARRPWRQIFDYHALTRPQNLLPDALVRLKTNIAYFRVNFMMFILFILFLSLLWHPISLIVFIVMMVAWLFFFFLRDEPLMVFGKAIDDRIVLVVLGALTLLFLFLTDATMNILISVGVGFFIVVFYSVFRKTDDLFLDEEAAEEGGLVTRSGGAGVASGGVRR